MKTQQPLSAKEAGKLYEKYAPVLYGLALRIVSDRARADMVLLNGFLSIIERSHEFNSANGSLFSWMVRIVIKESNSFVNLTNHQLLMCCLRHPKQIHHHK